MIKKGNSYCQEVIFIHKKIENSEFGKTCLSKFGCQGNSKFREQ